MKRNPESLLVGAKAAERTRGPRKLTKRTSNHKGSEDDGDGNPRPRRGGDFAPLHSRNGGISEHNRKRQRDNAGHFRERHRERDKITRRYLVVSEWPGERAPKR